MNEGQSDRDDLRSRSPARAAAEALFAPKQPFAAQQPADNQTNAAVVARKPRILSAAPATKPHPAGVLPSHHADMPPAPAITASQIARLWSYLK
jgi:hypothetical protein